jgi:hypothetical protein
LGTFGIDVTVDGVVASVHLAVYEPGDGTVGEGTLEDSIKGGEPVEVFEGFLTPVG